MSEVQASAPKRGFTQKMLDGIESLGNKVPHPAIIFLGLCVLVIVLSAVLAAFDVSVTYEVAEPPPISVQEGYPGGTTVQVPDTPAQSYQDLDPVIHTETSEIKSLLSVDGIRFIFTSFVQNFANFSVVAVILVAMIGVGVAEKAGLMAALIRKLVAVAPAKAITFIIVFLGILSSVASDAGYLILIPLAAAAFMSIGRHPLAGLAAAFAGVGAGFGVNVLITPTDGLVTEITNEAVNLVDPSKTIDLTANLYFSIVASFFLAIVITIITERLIEPRLGTYTPDPGHGGGSATDPDTDDVDTGDEKRGLRFVVWGVAASIAGIVLLTVPPGAPLRNPDTGSLINNSPFMDSLIFLITVIFLVAGICYGVGAGTMKTSVDVINAITSTWATLTGLIFLLLLIAQFIAYFNFSNMPTVAAVKMADVLERADIGAIWLLILLILVIALLDIIIPGVVPKWAIFAPIFIPLFLRLGVAPQTVLAAYRVGDSPVNVITPLMVYLPFIVVVAQRYRKDAGIGTVVSLMLPYTVLLLILWTAFFVVWYVLGIPLGPGSPVEI